MLNLEDFMNIRDLKQQGWSVSAIADELSLDRKTVRKHLLEAPQPYKRENPAPCKIDPYRPFLRERWETGVHNARKLLDEIRVRGYDGGYSQLKLAVTPWREEGRERAFVRFETDPGEQSQMDWGHFGNWGGRRLYGFALTMCYSRMRFIEFTQSQDIHHLLSSMVHGLRYFGGVTESVLTDRMKTVLLDQIGGELHFNQKFLQFAAYYGFVPRVCRPYRPETKAYASYCTSCEPRMTFYRKRRRLASLTPCALRGGLVPGSSYSQSPRSFTRWPWSRPWFRQVITHLGPISNRADISSSVNKPFSRSRS
jgi:transposase